MHFIDVLHSVTMPHRVEWSVVSVSMRRHLRPRQRVCRHHWLLPSCQLQCLHVCSSYSPRHHKPNSNIYMKTHHATIPTFAHTRHTHTHTRTHTHTHTHTHIHTHTHTHTRSHTQIHTSEHLYSYLHSHLIIIKKPGTIDNRSE